MKILAPAWLALSVLLASCSNIPVASTLTATLVPVTPTPSPTPMPPIAHVGGSVPCYADATKDAEILAMVEIGDGLEIIGEARAGNYWVVQPDGIDGYCWLESQYVTVEGDTGTVRHIVPTLIPPPVAPLNIHAEVLCERDGETRKRAAYALLSWEDVASETGYRIYKGDELIIELPPDQTSYRAFVATFGAAHNGNVIFYFEAFNKSGSSERVELQVGYFCNNSDYD